MIWYIFIADNWSVHDLYHVNCEILCSSDGTKAPTRKAKTLTLKTKVEAPALKTKAKAMALTCKIRVKAFNTLNAE